MNLRKYLSTAKQKISEKKLTRPQIAFLCIALASAIAFASCGTVFIVNSVKRSNIEEQYNELEKSFVTLRNPDSSSAWSSLNQLPAEYSFIVDFDAMHEINPDIYAWIKVSGTSISYPILQHSEDNAYYLDHTVKNVKGYPGSIYSENMNAKDFSDFVSVIYGHNMNNGTMFNGLHKYETESFFEQNRYIYIYTEDQINVYRIFAAVQADNRHILSKYDFTTDKGKQEYIDYLNGLAKGKNAKNHLAEDVNVTPNDKILTLSTCMGGNKKARWLINAVLEEFVLYDNSEAAQLAEEKARLASKKSVYDRLMENYKEIQVIDTVTEEDNAGAAKVE